MASKKNNAKKNVNNANKLAELKRRLHQHDVIIMIGDNDKRIAPAKVWSTLIESSVAQQQPEKLNLTVATATSAFWLAKAGDKLTEQYGTSHESHFGFTMRTVSEMNELKDIFSGIDYITMFSATNGECEKIDIKNIIKSFIGDDINCLVSVLDMEILNWIFKSVQFFCSDLLNDQGYTTPPQFYQVELLGEEIVRSWLVTSKDVETLFTTDNSVLIEDDGVKILLSKAAPTVEEIFYENDNYSVVSVHNAIKNIMTDYFCNHLS